MALHVVVIVVIVGLAIDTVHGVVTRDALLLQRCESTSRDLFSGRGGDRGRGDGGCVRGGGEREREVSSSSLSCGSGSGGSGEFATGARKLHGRKYMRHVGTTEINDSMVRQEMCCANNIHQQ